MTDDANTDEKLRGGGRGPYLTTLPHLHGTDGFFAAELHAKFAKEDTF